MLPGPRTRRFLIAAALFVCLVLVGWQFRPLTAAERRLVGTWRCDHLANGMFVLVTFAPDRTYSELVLTRPTSQGPWHAYRGYAGGWTTTGERLSLRQDPPGVDGWSAIFWRIRQRLRGESPWQDSPIEIEEEGRGRFHPADPAKSIAFFRVSDPELLRLAGDWTEQDLPARGSAARSLDLVLPPAPR